MSVTVFFSYSHKDEALRDKVAEHLSALKRSNIIQAWHDRQILPGTEWKDEIDRNLRTADIILLLVSASFLSSEYCWSEELSIAMTRHEAKEACVIPIILRPCFWQDTPFAKLQMLPKDAKAVTSWSNEDEALANVAEGIWFAVNQVAEKKELHSEKGIDYAPLRDMLKAGEWREADYETWRLIFLATGRKSPWSPGPWLSVEDVELFPCQDLRTIDQLWVRYSRGKFGFSIQKKIWQECGSPNDYNSDWKKFCARVGWQEGRDLSGYPKMTFSDSAPKGHLPLVFLWLFAWSLSSFIHRLAKCSTQQS